MAILTVSSLSRVYVRCAVALDRDGATVDPTDPALTVEMSLPTAGAAPSSWYAAAWEADGRGGWRCRVLVGPAGAVTLAPGEYDAWARVTSAPELPVAQSPDTLRIT